MSNSSIEATVSRLVDRLERDGLIGKLELSDEDIADILWLAAQMGVVEAKPKEPEPNQSKSEPDNVVWQDEDSKQNTEVDSQPDEVINVYPEATIEPKIKTLPQTKSLPFQAPAAPAIQNSLQISRALRPLMKKFPSARKRVLDEEATVTRIAERDVFVPVTKPQPERWLDLKLIVEESRSSFIWQETIDDLQQILKIHGAFRSVRVWTLSSDDTTTQLQLVRRKKGRRTSKRQHSYRELIHSDGRGLILLVSDCVSAIWQQGEIHHWLQQWSQKQPTAIVQLFPERMWDSTQLGVGRKLFSSALTPGVANPKLILENFPTWIPIDWQQALVLPVVNLEPEILRQWSRVVAGSGKAKISTYLFDLDFVTQQAKQKKTKPEVKPEAASQTAEEINSAKEREAEIIVKRFLATASITAQRLAGMMAAAPVDMQVVNLIRKTLLPEATPVHVAEVYMGGILESKVEAGSRIYQFRDGVRRLLNKAMAQYETEDVLDTISRYIAEEIDRPIRSFTALLALLPTYSEAEQKQILPFAEVAVEVLENLGGEYAEFAEEIQKYPNVNPKEYPPTEAEIERNSKVANSARGNHNPSVSDPTSVDRIHKGYEHIVAGIDIDDSIHIIVVKINARIPSCSIIAEEKDTVRLGERDSETGELTPEAIASSLATLKRYKELANSFNAEQIIAVATSSIREASNEKVFLDRIESELGIVVNLISGQETARRIYLGVLSEIAFNEQPHIIINIGGDSTELILADVHEARFLSSTKIGAVSLFKEFVTTDPISDAELKALRAYVRGMLERPVDEIWHNLQLNEVPLIIGTSGTIETIAVIHAKNELGTVPDPLNGYEITRKDIEKIVKKLAKMSYKKRLKVSGLSEKNVEIIVPGAMILLEAMSMLKVDSITICERSLREGMIVDWMLNRGLIDSRVSLSSRELWEKFEGNL